MIKVPHILIVDDDDDLQSLLTSFFNKHGHDTSSAKDSTGMFSALDTGRIDLVILDVMLGGSDDGFSLCRRLRASSQIPVIMLTSVADYTDRIVGLELGADDYLTKPFDQRELLARVRAILRRVGDVAGAVAPVDTRPVLCFADWRLDVARRELRSMENTLILLSGGEFDLLLAFAERPQRVLTRDQLLDLTRGTLHAVFDRSIDVHVSRLRHKLEKDVKNPDIIRTVRNGGYIFTPSVTRR